MAVRVGVGVRVVVAVRVGVPVGGGKVGAGVSVGNWMMPVSMGRNTTSVSKYSFTWAGESWLPFPSNMIFMPVLIRPFGLYDATT